MCSHCAAFPANREAIRTIINRRYLCGLWYIPVFNSTPRYPFVSLKDTSRVHNNWYIPQQPKGFSRVTPIDYIDIHRIVQTRIASFFCEAMSKLLLPFWAFNLRRGTAIQDLKVSNGFETLFTLQVEDEFSLGLIAVTDITVRHRYSHLMGLHRCEIITGGVCVPEFLLKEQFRCMIWYCLLSPASAGDTWWVLSLRLRW